MNAIILAVKQGSISESIFPFSTINQCQVDFTNEVYGNTLSALVVETSSCNYQDFAGLSSNFDLLLQNQALTSSQFIQQSQLLISSGSWSNCYQFARNFVSTTTGEGTLKNRNNVFTISGTLTTNCLYDIADLRWESDPCCNSELSQCCIPHAASIQPNDLYTSQCGHPGCILPLLSSLAETLFNQQAHYLSCDQDIDQIPAVRNTIETSIRHCYYATYGKKCSPLSNSPYLESLRYNNNTCADVDPQSICMMNGMCSIPCQNDSDCISGMCLKFNGYSTCYVYTSDQETYADKFVDCVVPSFTPKLLYLLQVTCM